MIEVAWHIGFIKHRKNPAVKFLIVTIELLGHPFIKEPLLGNLIVRMLRNAPVELPTRISPQLIIAAVESIRQDETAVHLTISQFQLLPFHKITILIEQLRIENTAQSARSSGITTTDIGLIIYGISQEIARIVHMNKHLLLWN